MRSPAGPMAPHDGDTPSTDSESSDDESEQVSEAVKADMESARMHRMSFKAPKAWMIILGVVLVAAAGMVDVITFLSTNTFTSHVTGTTAKIGVRLEGVRTGEMKDFDLVHALMTVASFIFGAFLCGLVIPRNQMHFGGKQFYGVALAGNSLLLIACCLTAPHVMCAYMAAAACGLQNAMCTLHLGAIIRTTHVTGTATDIGSTAGRLVMLLLQRNCRRENLYELDRAEIEVDVKRLKILSPLWFAFAAGAYFGCLLYKTANLRYLSFLVPASITGSLSVAYMCFGKFLKRKFKEYEQRRLEEQLKECEQLIGRVNRDLSLRKDIQEEGDDGAEDGFVGPSVVHRVEDDIEEMMEAMHEVEETLATRNLTRASSRPLVSGASQ